MPHDTIVNLKTSCLASNQLADKSHFVEAHKELANAEAECCVGMVVPTVKMDFGSSS